MEGNIYNVKITPNIRPGLTFRIIQNICIKSKFTILNGENFFADKIQIDKVITPTSVRHLD